MGGGGSKVFPDALKLPTDLLSWNEKHMQTAALFYFDQYDEDDSDSLDTAELDKLLKGVFDDCNFVSASNGAPTATLDPPEADEFLEENDLDENETISSSEICPFLVELFQKVKAHASMRLEYEAQVAKVFKEADKDANGTVSVEEFKEGWVSEATELYGEDVDEEWGEWYESCSEMILEAFDDAAGDDDEMTAAEFVKFQDEILPGLDFGSAPNKPATLSKGAQAVQKGKAAKAKKSPPKRNHKPPVKKAKGTGKKQPQKPAPVVDEEEEEEADE